MQYWLGNSEKITVSVNAGTLKFALHARYTRP